MLYAGGMFVAMLIEAVFGWPDGLYDRMGHPVTWMGTLIDAGDRRMNREGEPDWLRRGSGVALVLGICLGVWGLMVLVTWALPGGWLGLVLTGVIGWPLVATRSLYDHVRAVALPLARGDLPRAREAVAMIVGRDPELLDSAGVARAALESLGESTSDGVVAPLFWGLIFGLPGIAAYKAINTMDSMIGHLNPRHASFGWAAARIDDLVNLVPARLTGLLFAAVSGRWADSVACMRRDAGKHRSPNAGWPEAAMAGALGVRLSGPRAYEGQMSREPWVNEGAPDPVALDVGRGLDLYLKAMTVVALGLLVLAVI
ncbi:MAG: cobalamin biosynthesis protein CobD [Pseudorhodobacter sp.]|nr:cobalamin biosynthesis protein CobD [Pseudorhodobacter sp.]